MGRFNKTDIMEIPFRYAYQPSAIRFFLVQNIIKKDLLTKIKLSTNGTGWLSLANAHTLE